MSYETKTFTFKPALLKSRQSYFINKNQIELVNKDGSDTIVRFDSITSLRYADTSAREYKFRRFDIGYGDEKLMRIGITLPFSSKMYSDKDLSEFYRLLEEISARLDNLQLNISVEIGETSRINWIYFSIGALTVLTALGIFIGALVGGVSDQKLMDGLIPITIMAVFGSYICFMAKPWVSRPDINIAKFRLLIEKLKLGS